MTMKKAAQSTYNKYVSICTGILTSKLNNM